MLAWRVIAGEVHLETCIKDLRERFARVELTVSPPLVAFRESVADPAEAPDAVHRPPKVCPGTVVLLISGLMVPFLQMHGRLLAESSGCHLLE